MKTLALTFLGITVLLILGCVGMVLTGIWSTDIEFASNCGDTALTFGLLAILTTAVAAMCADIAD